MVSPAVPVTATLFAQFIRNPAAPVAPTAPAAGAPAAAPRVERTWREMLRSASTSPKSLPVVVRAIGKLGESEQLVGTTLWIVIAIGLGLVLLLAAALLGLLGLLAEFLGLPGGLVARVGGVLLWRIRPGIDPVARGN